ncbi:MAG TPA: hypothetical protein VMW41_00485 [Candidatus Bathyarchaeia archaeon]|nr:hypothetical protein [Candidatus Bathyarchaeia archaeon]
MKKQNLPVKTNNKQSAKSIEEYKTEIKNLLSTSVYGLEAQLDQFVKGHHTPKEATKKVSELLPLFNLDNCHSFRELVPDWNRGRATEFALQLYKEYNCQTASEKALAQTTVIAFEHILDYSRRLHKLLSGTGSLKVMNEKTYPLFLKRIQIIGLELDRANRQFLTALQTLKQIKTPRLEVKVKSKTAFVAQNQQFNVGNKCTGRKEENQNENIEA